MDATMIAFMSHGRCRMRHYRMRIVLAAILTTCGAARAEDWPVRPITLVVPYGAGGPTDVIGRLFPQQILAAFLADDLPVCVETCGRHVGLREPFAVTS